MGDYAQRTTVLVAARTTVRFLIVIIQVKKTVNGNRKQSCQRSGIHGFQYNSLNYTCFWVPFRVLNLELKHDFGLVFDRLIDPELSLSSSLTSEFDEISDAPVNTVWLDRSCEFWVLPLVLDVVTVGVLNIAFDSNCHTWFKNSRATSLTALKYDIKVIWSEEVILTKLNPVSKMVSSVCGLQLKTTWFFAQPKFFWQDWL
jgi:hypothetical protein